MLSQAEKRQSTKDNAALVKELNHVLNQPKILTSTSPSTASSRATSVVSNCESRESSVSTTSSFVTVARILPLRCFNPSKPRAKYRRDSGILLSYFVVPDPQPTVVLILGTDSPFFTISQELLVLEQRNYFCK
ncbi:MAG: hypothetical protein MMC33_009190 [Icmadophila ericetorum]|nr:hypothetical protein [Icmadophila ericetorum]